MRWNPTFDPPFLLHDARRHRLEREETERLEQEKRAKLAEMRGRFEREREEKRTREAAEGNGGVVYKGVCVGVGVGRGSLPVWSGLMMMRIRKLKNVSTTPM